MKYSVLIFDQYEALRKKVNSKFFTKRFYELFCEEYLDALEEVISGIYTDSRYSKTKLSEFYLKESGKYCEFLCEFNDMLPLFELQFSADVYDNVRTYTARKRLPDAGYANRLAERIADENGWYYIVQTSC